MSEGAKTLRLSKVAKEFNLSLGKIVEFLASKGHQTESNPNAKIGDSEYNLLLKEFSGDKTAREEAENVAQNITKVKRETILLSDVKAKKQKEEAEAQEFMIKDLAPKSNTVAPEKTEVTKEDSKTEELEVEKPTLPNTDGPKVVGKLDLDSMNLKTKPDKKGKKEVDKKEATGKKSTKDLPKVEEKIELPVANEIEIPSAKEEVKEEFLETKYEKLEGPKILRSIELPVIKEQSKKPVIDPNADKKKRKRIRKGGLSQEEIKKVGKEQSAIAREKAKEKYGDPRAKKPVTTPGKPRHELTEEEIQAQIKETLARLSAKGTKSKTSKYRREKRDDVREKMAEKAVIAEEDRKTLKVAEFVSANQLATMMDVQVTKIISTCMSLGLFVSINQRLDAETISIVAEEFGYKVEFASAEDIETIKEEEKDLPEDLISRPPIVTVMGHVDHGKTSLLDFVREANVVAGEAGGITQHIGAYNVKMSNGKSMTFLDTPGHEAFTAMRARGAKVTDIAIIVIAADDSIMPQTKEAINHAQAAGVPMIFAINKIDKPGANPDKIREALSVMNILVEEWGGKYQCQEVSAKLGKNIDLLLEKVILEADMMDLKANPNKNAAGSVIEASMEEGRGYVATILVQNGTLKIGDVMLAGSFSGRVRAMFNERGQKVDHAGPSHPVKVLGLSGAPTAGDKFNVMSDEREAREIANKRLQLQREQGIRTHKHITLDEIGRRLAIGDFKELNVIVKGDVDGSIEALSDSLLKLSTEKVAVNIIHKSVGAISESDVLLASASNAIIIGFQVRPSTSARKLAEVEEIDIRLYSIIYDAINEIKAAMEGMLSPEFEEKIVCNIEIREVFNITKVGTIAGCYVLDGKVTRNTKVRVIREGIVIHTGTLGSLKRFKDDVKEVSAGYECGLNIDKFDDIKVGDIIEGYDMIEIKAKL
ncbi:translation initiation factor IF-2 [Sediminibacterium sp.]|uniref:translation initiation factor IF-2 n=1 Tax=Sediminibacterium sp. TaxID=1917865 RepID=UPI0027213A50|nr:translation initiation factor IF-2 [Sediminibacterium sp.]MDO9000428.1 translation initiation factor IF-2 [Bacteroidota bacterium]MDP3147004.1 translation initiation factor IF-2 [Bacteroidota bacterium]MDP3567459.1 translation initiation factor IF-2 [Sediminibacterium sp.]